MAPSPEASQNSWVGWVQIAAIFFVVIAAIIITQSLSRSDESEPSYGASNGEVKVPVRIMTPALGSHQIEIITTGTATTRAMVALTAQVGGRVVEVSDAVRNGGTFQAGEILFSIDPSDYEIAIIRAEAALAEARSVYAQTEADADLARREWEETYPDEAITPLAAREPQLEAARSRVLSAQAELAQADLNLERTQVSFPYAGRIIESRLEEGLLLIAGQNYGMAYNAAELEVVAPVSPDELSTLDGAVGRSVELKFENGQTLSGRIVREGADLDDRSRLIDLYIQVDDPSRLRPGLFAEISIQGDLTHNVYQLPETAISGLDTAHIIREGKIERITVDVLERTSQAIITSQFEWHDGVIISPIPEDALGRDAEVRSSETGSLMTDSGANDG